MRRSRIDSVEESCQQVDMEMVTLRLGHEIEKRFILLVKRVVQRKVTRILHFARNFGVQLA